MREEAARHRATLPRMARLLAPLVVFLLLGAGWQWVALNLKSILPPLGSVFLELAARPGFYLLHLWTTLSAALSGFAIGAAIGVILAILIVHFQVLRAAILPVALMLNVTPVVAISPALIVAFGFNAVPHIIVAAISAFLPMLINALTGLRATDRDAEDVFRSLAASRIETLWHLRLPSSLPHLFAGARLAIAAAMVGSIVSEFMGTSKGIGATIIMATTYLNLPQMWVAIFISALTSLGLIGLVDLAERAVIRWA
ncbi:nitrate ABC transporter permease [Xaviernesmea oryzae]|uniref:Nitrate ABC transporter permease n=2 Tax=Xaviernesmea oryzae TaxID=464029 RepID=A0A1Q9AV60_9HYPH|nr:nitrate ABC transporter permease [Xaviernesmea oryzae]